VQKPKLFLCFDRGFGAAPSIVCNVALLAVRVAVELGVEQCALREVARDIAAELDVSRRRDYKRDSIEGSDGVGEEGGICALVASVDPRLPGERLVRLLD